MSEGNDREQGAIIFLEQTKIEFSRVLVTIVTEYRQKAQREDRLLQYIIDVALCVNEVRIRIFPYKTHFRYLQDYASPGEFPGCRTACSLCIRKIKY